MLLSIESFSQPFQAYDANKLHYILLSLVPFDVESLHPLVRPLWPLFRFMYTQQLDRLPCDEILPASHFLCKAFEFGNDALSEPAVLNHLFHLIATVMTRLESTVRKSVHQEVVKDIISEHKLDVQRELAKQSARFAAEIALMRQATPVAASPAASHLTRHVPEDQPLHVRTQLEAPGIPQTTQEFCEKVACQTFDACGSPCTPAIAPQQVPQQVSPQSEANSSQPLQASKPYSQISQDKCPSVDPSFSVATRPIPEKSFSYPKFPASFDLESGTQAAIQRSEALAMGTAHRIYSSTQPYSSYTAPVPCEATDGQPAHSSFSVVSECSNDQSDMRTVFHAAAPEVKAHLESRCHQRRFRLNGGYSASAIRMDQLYNDWQLIEAGGATLYKIKPFDIGFSGGQVVKAHYLVAGLKIIIGKAVYTLDAYAVTGGADKYVLGMSFLSKYDVSFRLQDDHMTIGVPREALLPKYKYPKRGHQWVPIDCHGCHRKVPSYGELGSPPKHPP